MRASIRSVGIRHLRLWVQQRRPRRDGGARDEGIAAGITINGLPVIGGEPTIVDYYSENVVGGPGAFVAVAHDIASFRAAVLRKLVTEIGLR
jgi:hypothetical protein